VIPPSPADARARRPCRHDRRLSVPILVALQLVARGAAAELIEVTPADDYTKIEAAGPGDEVVIAPGTYKFRVYLDEQGTAQTPIVIRAQDPQNRPVWDLGGQPVGQWPGSYGAGDKHRGCWQVAGSHYVISGIEFRNCQDSASAGLRAINCGPLTVRDCVFAGNTNGLTGSSEQLLIEFSEFFDNGKQQAGNPSHNIYLFGGKLTLRYSYLHDPTEGQNLHIRAAESVIEYNWITRPASYPGDLMSCEHQCGGSGSNPITQRMILRGNVIVQGQPANRSQIIALYNDETGGSNDGTGAVSEMELTMIHNTIIGTPVSAGQTQRLVNMRNDSVGTTVHLHNNIIYRIKQLAVASEPATSNWSVDGQNNWISADADAGSGLTGTLSGTNPGFDDPGSSDYTLAAGTACVGQAAAVAGQPTAEYYRDETVKLQYRMRLSADDLGAFEHDTTGAGIGPYGTAPPPTDGGGPASDGGATSDGAPAGDGAVKGDAGAADGASGPGPGDGGSGGALADDSGCSCELEHTPASPGAGLVLFGLIVLVRRTPAGPRRARAAIPGREDDHRVESRGLRREQQ
jgi:hypothetical protein